LNPAVDRENWSSVTAGTAPVTWILFEQIVTQFPAEGWLIVEDNLSIHTSRQVQMPLLSWLELQVQIIPQYACWLNLI
jgi:hypothetical protein